jgi:hypothetical protein
MQLPDPRYAPGSGGNPLGYKDWTLQRDLTDDLSTVEGLDGSTYTWNVSVNDNGNAHIAYLDGIVVKITYRPFGALRPLRGCATTRTEWRQDSLIGGRPGINPGYDWLDADWGPNSDLNSPTLTGDQAWGNFSGTGGGNGIHDDQDCPLLDVNNSKGRVKFHVQGMIYAPSSVISLSGYDNDAQWVTQNITARQVSAIRFRDGGGIPGVGGELPKLNDRDATIEVRDGNTVVLRAVIHINDDKRRWGNLGRQVTIKSWIRYS